MKNWLTELCSSAFMPHGQCYLWQPELVGLHAVADSLIALSYFSIPLVILHFVRHRRDLPFPAIFLMFGAFIVACGTTHLMEVITIWQPAYWLSGGIKLTTAAISLVSAVAVVRVVPAALELPSPDELRRLNATLEERVRARTAELTAANEQLRREAAQREEAEAEVNRLNTELRTRLAELQSLFKLLPVGVGIATDASCRQIRFNRAYAEMHGLPAGEHGSFSAPPVEVAKHFRTLRDGRELRPEELPMPRAIATNTPVSDFEKTIMRNDGKVVEVLAHAVPIRDETGQPCGCVATFQDITTRKQAERQRLDVERRLQQGQKLESIGVLAGGVAHDFNNLLTGILGNTSLARLELANGSHDVDRFLAEVESSSQRAAELCRQLLAYAGRGRLVVKPLDLNLCVEQALALVRLSISRKVTLDLQSGETLPPFRGDPTQIHQILMNLGLNASEAIGDKAGTITIRTERVTLAAMDLLTLQGGSEIKPGNCVCLTVADNGCGIPPESMGQIFEPFFTTKFIGRGLGLAAVLGMVHGHGGGIRVTSQVGSGTTFELFLPVLAPLHPPSSTPLPGTTRGTVLVVDDEDTVRKVAAAALEGAGFTVVTASDGTEALAHLQREATRFDAVLLDLTMPKLDGEDTLVALRLLSPDLPVILTSGYHEKPGIQRLVARGLADFLPKPFTGSALVARVSAAIASRDHRA